MGLFYLLLIWVLWGFFARTQAQTEPPILKQAIIAVSFSVPVICSILYYLTFWTVHH